MSPAKHVSESNDWAKETEAKAKRLQSEEDKTSVYAGRVQRFADASPETKAPVQVLRIGDVCIGTSPCETFAETGLEFKERCPIKHSSMVELANGYYGYLPPPRHFELGGYETWPGTNYLEPQASVKIMDALLEMAVELTQKVSLKTSARDAFQTPGNGKNFGVWRITNEPELRHWASYHNTRCFSPDGRYLCYAREANQRWQSVHPPRRSMVEQ